MKAEDSLSVFEFVSEGPRGKIYKLIKFSQTNTDGIYNLAFGDRDPSSGEIDDFAVSDNGDSEVILATVVAAVYSFTESRRNAWVYATGSTRARTRLYRMGISKYLSQAVTDFNVYGLLNGEWERFSVDVAYTAFLIQRR